MNIPGFSGSMSSDPIVVLRGRDLARGDTIVDALLTVSTLDTNTSAAPQPVKIHSVEAKFGHLTVTYCRAQLDCNDRSNQLTLKGTDLGRLTLKAAIHSVVEHPDTGATFEMVVKPRPTTSTKIPKYDITYRQSDRDTWMNHCDPQGVVDNSKSAASFLQWSIVDGLNAAVTLDRTSTTIGCESGAIATCLDWGYFPWNPVKGNIDPLRNYVFGSCLQAKRAAFFVGDRDFKSYTRNGTIIDRRDEFGFGRDSSNRIIELTSVEAIWSPQGAVCINQKKLRRADINLVGTPYRPECGDHPSWSETGKLATGRVIQEQH